MSTRTCPIDSCTKTWTAKDYTDVDILSHVTQAHMVPASGGDVVLKDKSVLSPKDNDDLVGIIKSNAIASTTPPPAQAVTTGFKDVMQDVGVLMSNAVKTTPNVAGGGGRATARQIKLWPDALQTQLGYKPDMTSIFVNFAYAVCIADATEETEQLGSALIEAEPSVAAGNQQPRELKWKDAFASLNTTLETAGLPKVTPRQVARFFAKGIWKLINENDDFKRLSQIGTPISNKFTADTNIWYASLSFFEEMKAIQDWTPAEAELNKAHVASIVKQPRRAAGDKVKFRGVDQDGQRTALVDAAMATPPETPIAWTLPSGTGERMLKGQRKIAFQPAGPLNP